jgi:MSHA pilin protein MshC
MKLKHHQTGFTLIELIVVLILIGVLAVSLVPRFFTASGTSEYVYRDEALNLLRRVQMQAMQCTNCTSPTVTVSASSILAGGNSCASDSSLALCPAANDNISFSANYSPISFTSLGQPVGCVGQCQLTIQGSSALRLCIETEGYVHPC